MGNKRSRSLATDVTSPAAPYSQEEAGLVQAEQPPPSKKSRVETSQSLFVRSLPPSATTESLTDFFSQHFPVKHATVILDPKTKESRGYGFVTFTDADDAKEAVQKLNKQKLDGRSLLLEVAESRHRQTGPKSTEAAAKKEEREAALAEARKAPKLIIRNLPWSIKKSEQLAALFVSYGKVKFSDLPQNKGKLSGFGFVTLRGHKNAENAIEGLNGKVVDGRTIAVDWAVDKKTWQGQQRDEEKEPKAKEADKVDDKLDDKEDDVPEKNDFNDEEDEDMRNFMKNHFDNLEDEDSELEGEDEDEEDIGDEGHEGEDDEDDEDGGAATKKPLTTNNDTTVFIRNLPFSATDETLKEHFEQFGPVRYARIVMDRALDRPAGTGFVCFISQDDSKACLRGAPRPQETATTNKKHSILQNEMADQEGRYTIDGRILHVSQAVSKDEAGRLAESGAAARKGKDTDKRRLYLLSEGTISNDSPLHQLLTPAEIKLRDQSASQRKKLIQTNPSLHLSLTRLAVRNMPRDMDSKKLKALAREAIVGFATDVKHGKRQPLSREELMRGGEEDREAERRRKQSGKGIVRQTKIVFENKQGSKVGENDESGRSRGYGFIEYWSHSWALKGLRWLNGHAVESDKGKTQRLVVEFAIENAQVVARRRDLQARFKAGGKDENANAKRPNGKSPQRGDKRHDKKGTGKDRLPKGKDFAVSKGKRQAKPTGKATDQKHDIKRDGGNGGGKDSQSSARKELDQKIIGRKRMVRKKKASMRG